jgi:hypothetical protein
MSKRPLAISVRFTQQLSTDKPCTLSSFGTVYKGQQTKQLTLFNEIVKDVDIIS